MALPPALPSEPPPAPFQSCFWGHCLAGNSGQQPRSPRLPLSWADGPPTCGAAPQPDTHTPHGLGDRATCRLSGRPPAAAGGWAGQATPCPLSTESAQEPALPGTAFSSQGTDQRRKATGPGGAWGHGRPHEPLKAGFCTGWHLFSAAGSDIGDANCSQICFKQRDRSGLKAPWSPWQWVGGFRGEGSGCALLHSSTSSLPSQGQRGPRDVCFLPCSAMQGAVLWVRRPRGTGRPAHMGSGSSWMARQDGGEVPSQAAQAAGSLRSGCWAMPPLRNSLLGVDAAFFNVLTWGRGGALVPPLLRKPWSHHGTLSLTLITPRGPASLHHHLGVKASTHDPVGTGSH